VKGELGMANPNKPRWFSGFCEPEELPGKKYLPHSAGI
jgi:hypothetical protein